MEVIFREPAFNLVIVQLDRKNILRQNFLSEGKTEIVLSPLPVYECGREDLKRIFLNLKDSGKLMSILILVMHQLIYATVPKNTKEKIRTSDFQNSMKRLAEI